jgi:hypothetical protein
MTEEVRRTVPSQVVDESAPAEQEVVVARPEAAVAKPRAKAKAAVAKPKAKAAVAKPQVAIAKSEAEEPEIPAQPGLITVSSYPWSEVWIDGKRAGDIPLNEHSLPAGVHTIRLVFPTAGNRELTEKIEVRAGKHLKIVRKLDLTTPQPEN